MTEKKDPQGFTDEGGSVGTQKQEVFSDSPETVSDAVKVKKSGVGRGRPVSKPASKPAIFHLSLELISKIDKEATENMLGNKSALATKIFSNYFASKEDSH